jgi:hypothetical protein
VGFSKIFKKKTFLSFFVGFIGLLTVANATLNHFFAKVGFVLDCGLLAFYFTQTINLPQSLGGASYFSTHFSPFLLLSNLIFRVFPVDGITSYFFFSLFLALLHALMGLFVSLILLHPHHLLFPGRENLSKFLALIVGLGTVLSPASSAGILYPHWEIGIVTCGLGFYALWLYQLPLLALICLTFGLSLREDVGFHYFGIAFLIASWAILQKPRQRKVIQQWVFIGSICFGYSIIVSAVKYVFFPGDNAFRRIYMGETGFFQHVSLSFLAARLKFFFVNRITITLPILGGFVCALASRCWGFSLGSLAVLPWCILSLLAVCNAAGKLDIYYAFLLVFSAIWPLLWPIREYGVDTQHLSQKAKAVQCRGIFMALFFCVLLFDKQSRFVAHRLIVPDWITPWVKLSSFHKADPHTMSMQQACETVDKMGLLMDIPVSVLCLERIHGQTINPKEGPWIDVQEGEQTAFKDLNKSQAQLIESTGFIFKLRKIDEKVIGNLRRFFSDSDVKLCQGLLYDHMWLLPLKKIDAINHYFIEDLKKDPLSCKFID